MNELSEREAQIEASWNDHNKIDKQPSINRQRSGWLLKRLEEQNHQCYYCFADIYVDVNNGPNRATCEHKEPRNLGGPDSFENVVAACAPCNNIKDNIPFDIFMQWVNEYRSSNSSLSFRSYITVAVKHYRATVTNGGDSLPAEKLREIFSRL